MEKRKIEVKDDDKISTPVLLSSEENVENENKDTEKKDDVVKVESTQNGIYESINSRNFYNSFNGRNGNMINAINSVNQTVQPLANVVFNGNNVRTNACNSCCGWLNHNENSGIFTLTKPGIYKVHFNANVAPTVAGAITLNISNAGESIAGGQMQTPGTTVGAFSNISSEILVRVPCNSSVVLTIKNNTPTNPITVAQPSLTITREA